MGEYPCILDRNSNAFTAYKTDLIKNDTVIDMSLISYKSALEKVGIKFFLECPLHGKLTEIIERPDHPLVCGNSVSPEFTSAYSLLIRYLSTL